MLAVLHGPQLGVLQSHPCAGGAGLPVGAQPFISLVLGSSCTELWDWSETSMPSGEQANGSKVQVLLLQVETVLGACVHRAGQRALGL